MYKIEYSSNKSETTGSLWFYSKDEATKFNDNIENTDSFKSFEYNDKLLSNTVAQPASNKTNRIQKTCNNCCTIKISK